MPSRSGRARTACQTPSEMTKALALSRSDTQRLGRPGRCRALLGLVEPRARIARAGRLPRGSAHPRRSPIPDRPGAVSSCCDIGAARTVNQKRRSSPRDPENPAALDAAWPPTASTKGTTALTGLRGLYCMGSLSSSRSVAASTTPARPPGARNRVRVTSSAVFLTATAPQEAPAAEMSQSQRPTARRAIYA